jgi:hypothetical protein
MAMEKKSLVGKKAAPTQSKSVKSKVDISKPAASKVVAAKPLTTGPGGNKLP